MKFKSIISLLLAFTLVLPVFGQNFSISYKGLPIEQVIRDLESKTNYTFVYQKQELAGVPRITLTLKNAFFEDILSNICAEAGITYEIALQSVVLKRVQPSDSAQSLTVKGVVSDETGQPIIGASVFIKGTRTGSATDIDGSYSISAMKGQALVFSCIGYAEASRIANSPVINITLSDEVSLLDETVVVGYGTTKKSNLTGAVGQIGQEFFKNRPVSNIQQMLTGVIPGLSATFSDGKPSRTTTFQIRGTGSLANINSSPEGNALVLIDGVEGDPELINPNDIESVSVLKDAASAAIYGARGPYGVVLITTKDPAKNSDKVVVNYSMNLNFASPTAIPDLVTDGLEYAELSKQAYYGYYDNYTDYLNYNKTHYFYGTIENYVNNFKAFRNSGRSGVVDVDNQGRYRYYASTDWYDALYKDAAFSQIHNLSVSGKSGNISYYASGRLYDYDGLYYYDPDTYDTNNFRLKLSSPVFSWLNWTENIEYTFDKLHQPVAIGTNMNGESGDLGDATVSFSTPEQAIANYGFSTMPIYNPDGTLTLAGAYVFGAMINRSSYVDVLKKSFKTTTGLEASFFNNSLRFKADYTYRDRTTNKRQKKTGVAYSEVEGVASNILNDTKQHQQYLADQYTFLDYLAANAYGEFEKTFNGVHYFKAIVGYNYVVNSALRYNFAKRGLIYGEADSYEFTMGEWDSKNKEFDNNVKNFSSKTTRWRAAGIFSRMNYVFNDRYLVEFNARYDGSSKFSANKQWAFFPSVSTGWRVSKEPWWPVKPSIISDLKFRASYGSLGDAVSIAPYGYEEYFNRSDYSKVRVIDGSSNYAYFEFPGDINSGLTWSTVETTNFGVDMGLFNGKISLTGDYYIRRTLGMIISCDTYSDTFGTTQALANDADMSTYGWEVEGRYHDVFKVRNKPMHVGFRFGISDNYTIVDRFRNDTGGIGDNEFRAGQRYGELWGYRTNGFFKNEEQIRTAFKDPDTGTSKPYEIGINELWTNDAHETRVGDIWLLDLNEDGKITAGSNTVKDPGDREIIADISPHYQYSFGFDVDWNGFFINATFEGIGKHQWSPAGKTVFWGLYGKNCKQMLKWTAENIWSPENPDALFPRLSTGNYYFTGNGNNWSQYYNQYPLDRYIFNIGYINLQTIQIGYNIPRKLTKKVNLSNIKVYFSGENLWNWSPLYKYTRDFDARVVNSHGDDPSNGISWGSGSLAANYPMLKTFSFGISLTY